MSAFLSVGIDSSAAKAGLLELRKWIAASVSDLSVKIDPESIDRQIQGFFKTRTFKFKVDVASFKEIKSEIENELSGALSNAFKKERREVNWNWQKFNASVEAALGNAFYKKDRQISWDRAKFTADVSLAIGQAFAAPQKINIDQANLAAQLKAASITMGGNTVAAAVPSVNLGRDVAIAITQALTGPVDELGKAAVAIGGVARKIGARVTEGDVRYSQSQSATLPGGIRLTSRSTLDEDSGAALLASAQTLPNRALLEQEMARLAKMRAGSASSIDPRVLLGLPSRDETKSLGGQIAAQMRDGVRTEALRAGSASAPNARLLLGLPSEADVRRLSQQIKAQMAEAAQQARLEMARIYEQSKDQFRLGGRNSRDSSALAAQGLLRNGYSRGDVSDFLGKKAYLLDAQVEMKKYNSEVRKNEQDVLKAGGAHRIFGSAVNEVHSGVRGLLGSMGMMWLTWGSIAPLLAGAAVGGAVNSMLQTGRELEYQLTFIRELAGGATVNVDQFNAALVGTQATTTEAAAGMRGLAQNGLNVQESLLALPTILRLATAGEMELSAAALGATGVMAAFNLQIGDLDRVSDVFAKAAASSNTSVAEMVEAMKQASTVGDQYNVTLEQTAASLEVLAKRNITGSAAGTAFRNMLTELAAPTEKARRAMQQLGLEIFDSENRLKAFPQLMEELYKVTSGLNEKGRLTFLGEIFDERGVKAANALLSDMELLRREIKALEQDSDGFTKKITDALSQTTTGKWKRLVTEFQQVTTAAFFESSDSVKNFLDELRKVVASEDFAQAVRGIATTVADLSKFVAENYKAIMALTLGYAALKVALGATGVLITAFSTYTAAATASATVLTGSLAALRLAMTLIPVVAIIGGIATLATMFLTKASAIDRAKQAAEAHNNTIREQVKLASEESERLQRHSNQLVEEIRLLRAGVDVVEARREAEKRLEEDRIGRERNEITRQIQESESRVQGGRGQTVPAWKVQEEGELQKQLYANLAALDAREETLRRVRAQKRYDDQLSEHSRLFQEIVAFNKRVSSLKDEGKLKGEVEPINAQYLSGLRDRAIPAMREALERGELQLNSSLSGYSRIDPGAESQLRRSALAELKEREAGYKRQVDALEAYYQADEAITRAREQAKLITAEEYETRREEMAERQLEKRLELARTELDQIRDFARRNERLEPADREQLETRLRNAAAEVDQLQVQLDTKVQQAAIKVQGALKEISDTAKDARVKGVLRDLEALRELNAKANEFEVGFGTGLSPRAKDAIFPQQYIGSVSTAGLSEESKALIAAQRDAQRRENFKSRQEAKYADVGLDGKGAKNEAVKEAMKAYDDWASTVSQFALMVDRGEREIQSIMDRRAEIEQRLVSETAPNVIDQLMEEFTRLEKSGENVQKRVALARRELSEVEKLQKLSAESRANAAEQIYDRQRTVEYGMLSFWKQYSETAQDNAKLVANVMGNAFNSMEQAMSQFVNTGKLNFKSLVASILADAARMMASQAIRQMISLGMNFAFSAGGTSSSTVGTMAPAINSSMVGASFASGGIMTPWGPAQLKSYSKGGVASGYRPQVSVFGEVRKPEAYVPLEDGRTIPVTVSGGGGGSVYSEVNVHVHMDGSVSVSQEGNDQQAKALGQLIKNEVIQVIQAERRPGGLLTR